jgi:predicted N-acetyltransferase YhbS
MATEYHDLTKEQRSAITRVKRALENLKKHGMIVVMVDGTPCVYSKEDYDNASDVDCGFNGVKINEEQINYLDTLSNIVH